MNRHCSHTKNQISNKYYMEQCSTSLIIREMQTKTSMKYYYIPVRMTKIKKTEHTKSWQDYRGWNSHTTASGNEKWCDHFGKQFVTLL